jgi:hypothetical protein
MPRRKITVEDRQNALVAVTLELEQAKKTNANLTAHLDAARRLLARMQSQWDDPAALAKRLLELTGDTPGVLVDDGRVVIERVAQHGTCDNCKHADIARTWEDEDSVEHPIDPPHIACRKHKGIRHGYSLAGFWCADWGVTTTKGTE